MLSLKVDIEVVVSENDCTSLCAHITQALDDAFDDSYSTDIKKMNITMVKEEDNEDHV